MLKRLKAQIATLNTQLGMNKNSVKTHKMEHISADTQEKALALLDLALVRKKLINQYKSLQEEVKASRRKKPVVPETIIVKGVGHLPITDETKPCGHAKTDARYKTFLWGMEEGKVPVGHYLKVYPMVIAEYLKFRKSHQIFGYMRQLLLAGASKHAIRRQLNNFIIGQEALEEKLEALRKRFIKPNPHQGYKGFKLFNKRTYRFPDVFAVRGEGQYARMLRV